MSNSPQKGNTTRLVLRAETAGDLMTTNPVSIEENATVKEAVAFLIDKGFNAAPVIDKAGRPIGVLSRADILIHDREQMKTVPAGSEARRAAEEAPGSEPFTEEFPVEEADRTWVRDIMTPAVFSVAPETPALTVVEEMLAMKVHRLFVVDNGGVLIGVISAFDVLRHLWSEREGQPLPFPTAPRNRSPSAESGRW